MDIVILGANDLGTNLSIKLSSKNHNIFIIDSDDSNFSNLESYSNIMCIHSSLHNLYYTIQNNISRFDCFISCTPEDEKNIFYCFIASKFNFKINIPYLCYNYNLVENNNILKNPIGFINNEDFNKLGITSVIPKYDIIFDKLVDLISCSLTLESVKLSNYDLFIKGFKVNDNHSICNKTIKEFFKEHKLSNLILFLIKRNGKVYIPQGNQVVISKDKLYFLGFKKDLDLLYSKVDPDVKVLSRILIYGISDITYSICSKLYNNYNYKIRVIEENSEKAKTFAQSFDNIDVICGSALKHNLFVDEGLDKSEVFISLSNSYSNNLFYCMFVKKYFPHIKTISVLSNNYSSSLYYMLYIFTGIDITLDIQKMFYNNLLTYLDNINFVFLQDISDEFKIGVFKIHNDFNYLNIPITNITMPKNSLIVSIVRDNKTILPSSSDIFKYKDSILIFYKEINSSEVYSFFNY